MVGVVNPKDYPIYLLKVELRRLVKIKRRIKLTFPDVDLAHIDARMRGIQEAINVLKKMRDNDDEA